MLKNFDNKTGEGVISFLPWRTSGPEYEQDPSRWYCHITCRGENIFEYGCPCGTCGITFRKVCSPSQRVSDNEAAMLLGQLEKIPPLPTLERLARILEPGNYHPLIIERRAKKIVQGSAEDFFSNEVVALFGLEPPEYRLAPEPGTEYYRFGKAYEVNQPNYRGSGCKALITAILMPLHDPAQLDRDRIEYWKDQYKTGHILTAFAISVIDHQAPAFLQDPSASQYSDLYLFTNCLLDGHHRVQAAAELGAPIRILTFLSSEYSLANGIEDILMVTDQFKV